MAFYSWGRLPFDHVIWHVFCVAGSVTQFIAVCWGCRRLRCCTEACLELAGAGEF